MTMLRANLRHCLDLSPTTEVAEIELLRLYGMRGALDELIRLEIAIKKRPRPSFSTFRELARAFWKLKRFDKAVPLFKECVSAKPGDAAAHYDLARALAATNRHSEAEASFSQALELAPEKHAIRYDFARSLMALNRSSEAEAKIREGLAELNDVAGNIELARLLATQGRHRISLKQLRGALVTHPGDYKLYREIAQIHRVLDQQKAAETAFKKALQLAKGDIGLQHDFARFKMSQKRYDVAIGILQAIEMTSPDRPGLRRHLVECLSALGRASEAEHLLRDVVGKSPKNIDAQVELLSLLSQTPDEGAADAAFTAATMAIGENELLLREHVRGKMRHRLLKAADVLLNRLLENDPHSHFGLLYSTPLAMMMRRYDKAKAFCETLLEFHPRDVEVLYEWGRVNMETAGLEKGA